MFSWNKPLTIEDRRNRFHLTKFTTQPTITRKIGISNDQIYPRHLEKLITEYYQSLPIHHIRYKWLNLWIKSILQELKDLERYPLDDVERVVIVYKEVVIFDFYLIYDLHIQDPETVCINLDLISEKSTSFGNLFQALGLIASIGTFAFFMPNVF